MLFKPSKELTKVEKIKNSNNQVDSTDANPNTTGDKMINTLLNIEKTLAKILEKYEENERKNEIKESKLLKWRFAALVMDRFFLCLFTIYFVITFIAIVMTAPDFYRGT